jgi:hypothetical protein
MSTQDFFGLLSVLCSAIGYGIYIKSIVRRRTKPHLFSWIVWTAVLAIVFLAQLSKGAGAGAWASGSSALACLIIALFGITRGEKNITPSDWIALAGGLTMIPVWYLTRDPLWVVVLAVAIDALAYYPTFRKSWFKPDEENPFLYAMDILKWLISFVAMSDYSLTTMLYPLFLIAANSALIGMICWRRHYSGIRP